MSRRPVSLCLFALVFAACGGGPGAPTTPTATPPSTPPLAPVPTPPTGQTAFSVGLPIRLQDFARNAYGLNPFGVHLGDHGTDGHPGWDFEYVPGADVYAAAAGTVQTVLPNSGGSGWGIQLTHAVGGQNYRTVYGVGVPAAGVTAGSSIAAGQALGTAAVYTLIIGRTPVTFGMTHFQVDDFSRSAGQTNFHAVPPETHLDAESRRTLDQMFRDAAYGQEIVEPFLANPRDVTFPQARTWLLQSGDLAPRIDVARERHRERLLVRAARRHWSGHRDGTAHRGHQCQAVRHSRFPAGVGRPTARRLRHRRRHDGPELRESWSAAPVNPHGRRQLSDRVVVAGLPLALTVSAGSARRPDPRPKPANRSLG